MKFLTTEKSLLDLILTKEPDLTYNVQDLGNFGTSDHKLICCNLDMCITVQKTSKTWYDYKNIDLDGTKSELGSIDWIEFSKGSVEECWFKFKNLLKDLQQRFVPVVKYKENNKAPWLNYKALKSVKRKHRICGKYKDSNHPAL